MATKDASSASGALESSGAQSGGAPAQSAGAAGAALAPVPARTRRGSTFAMSYGRRRERAYPLTEPELEGLFGIGAVATILFALGSAALGFCVNIHKDLQLNTGVTEKVAAFWDTMSNVALVVGIAAWSLGVVAVLVGKNHLKKIKQRTEFD